MIKNAEFKGDIQGAKIYKEGPTVTNLFFADDSKLFQRATLHEGNYIK